MARYITGACILFGRAMSPMPSVRGNHGCCSGATLHTHSLEGSFADKGTQKRRSKRGGGRTRRRTSWDSVYSVWSICQNWSRTASLRALRTRCSSNALASAGSPVTAHHQCCLSVLIQSSRSRYAPAIEPELTEQALSYKAAGNHHHRHHSSSRHVARKPLDPFCQKPGFLRRRDGIDRPTSWSALCACAPQEDASFLKNITSTTLLPEACLVCIGTMALTGQCHGQRCAHVLLKRMLRNITSTTLLPEAC